MKTIVLHVPDEADEASVLAALRELQQTTPFYLENDLDALFGPAFTPAEWEQRLKESEASGTVSWEEAKARFNL
jgi:hypothetical protein